MIKFSLFYFFFFYIEVLLTSQNEQILSEHLAFYINIYPHDHTQIQIENNPNVQNTTVAFPTPEINHCFDLSHSGSLSLFLNLKYLDHHHCPLGLALFTSHLPSFVQSQAAFCTCFVPQCGGKSPVVLVHSPIGHFGYHQSLAILIKATYTHSCTFLSEHYFMHEHYFCGNRGGIIGS